MKKRHKGLFVSTLLATIFLVAFSCTFFIYQKPGRFLQHSGFLLANTNSLYIAEDCEVEHEPEQ